MNPCGRSLGYALERLAETEVGSICEMRHHAEVSDCRVRGPVSEQEWG